ncbi:MAG: hypothetical protein ACE1S7_06825, partial [Candidatus Tisiphia sp.]
TKNGQMSIKDGLTLTSYLHNLSDRPGDFDLNATKADQITFINHADSRLVLRNSAAANKTITLGNNLNPGADGKGIVELDSVGDGKTLTIAGAGKHLGTAVNKLKKVIFLVLVNLTLSRLPFIAKI